ncbi:MAG: replication-associated recombination protein A, partial [Firmicutes bacterium]|nr:replication-associated recombination protein A [Bacillota bacterium]
MDLFESQRKSASPLAERMRATTLEEFLGQEHLISPDSLLARMIKADRLGSSIFFGPPGTGKTTLANIIANTTGANYVYLNAVSSGVNDAKKVIEDARQTLSLYGKKTYLLLDECHRWNKAQQDSILSAIEKGEIIFIGGTTENPFYSMNSAIISRCRLFEFKPLKEIDIKRGLLRAIGDTDRGFGKMRLAVSEDAINHFIFSANGDLRKALNALEISALSTSPNKNGEIIIDKTVAEDSSGTRALSVTDDLFYDILSAFGKSLRGSDPDASVYYALRLIKAGGDPITVLRRLIAHASEDIGLADPNALVQAVSALTAFKNLGLPEGKIPLTQAIIYVALAPKSN